MDHDNNEEIDKYLVEFESRGELYENDVETFIERRNIESAYAEALRGTLQLGRDIELLAETDLTDDDEQNRADDLSTEFNDNYQFIRELGRGGMGTVWLAEQRRPQRKVAIKLVRTDLASRLLQRRFKAEQQSLALMSHVSIAKVIEAGSIGKKRPYFVMEYIKGIPITEYCNEHRFSLRRRLALFLQLCDAIQHAHQKGVIHRDIKPSNILVTHVDGKPQVKVIDFGLGKIIFGEGANLDLTQADIAIGSPMWMSPEQTGWKTKAGSPSKIGTRSDVYSLGVILYQLLTNATPIDSGQFASAGRAELFEAIRNEVPPYPSRRVTKDTQSMSWLESQSTSSAEWKNTLRDDLDWVTMKALEKEPDRRYATTSALADDLRRFVSGNAVLARPPSLAYQLKKCVTRHKVTSIAALSLIACTAVSIYFVADSNRSRRLAEEQKVIALNESTIRKQVIDGLAVIIEAANAYAPGVKYSKQSMEQMIHLTKQFDDLPPEHQIQLRMTLAPILKNFGEVELAKTECIKVLDLTRSSMGDSNPLTMKARNALSFIYLERRENRIAQQLLATNKELISKSTDEIEPEIQLRCELGLVRARHSRQGLLTAIDGYRTVADKCKKQLTEGHTLTIDALRFLGEGLNYSGKFEEADQAFTEAKQLSDQFIGTDSMQSLELAIDILENQGKWKITNDFTNGLNQLDTLDILVEKLGESHPKIMLLRSKIAGSLMNSGQSELALRVVEDGILGCQRSTSNRKNKLPALWLAKLSLLEELKRSRKAIECYENEVAPTLFDCLEPDSMLNLAIQATVASAYISSGDSKQATHLIKTYEPIARQVVGNSGEARNSLRNTSARILQQNGQYEDAVDILEDIVVELTKRFGERSRKVVSANYLLGKAIDLTGRPADAVEVFEHVNTTAQPNHPRRYAFTHTLAEHHLHLRHHERSFDLCEELQNAQSPEQMPRQLKELRFQNRICHAEAAAQLGKLDVAQEIIENIKNHTAEIEHLSQSPELDRLPLIKGICKRQRGEYPAAEALLLSGLSKVSEKSGLERPQAIKNTLTTRRYAIELATLYKKWGKHQKAKQYRSKQFEFAP